MIHVQIIYGIGIRPVFIVMLLIELIYDFFRFRLA